MATENQVWDSEYIIDGVRMEMTPRQMLEQCMAGPSVKRSGEMPGTGDNSETIVDESLDPSPVKGRFDVSEISYYQSLVRRHLSVKRKLLSHSPADVTRAEIAGALIDMIWMGGHFRLDDLAVTLRWHWNRTPVGSMASFYLSVAEACSYLDSLGVRINSYEYVQTGGDSVMEVTAGLECRRPDMDSEDETLFDMPYKTTNPSVGKCRKCSGKCSGNPDNWLIYIPFDTSKYRLGGSLLEEVTGIPGGRMPEVEDFDYFIDCYEVVREFVEDGVIVSASSAGRGGLVSALERLAGSGCAHEAGFGADVDIAEIMRSGQEDSPVNVLFGEIPGVLIEIRPSEFDYVDAELLLQDIAYYPIGHPGQDGVHISWNRNSALADILQSLIGSQTAEGED